MLLNISEKELCTEIVFLFLFRAGLRNSELRLSDSAWIALAFGHASGV